MTNTTFLMARQMRFRLLVTVRFHGVIPNSLETTQINPKTQNGEDNIIKDCQTSLDKIRLLSYGDIVAGQVGSAVGSGFDGL
jgi:hypothetical protein